MIGRLLLAGLFAGLLAGLLAFGIARIWGEPPIEAAIALEGGHDHGAPAHAADEAHGVADTSGDEDEAVSRATQAGLGLLVGMTVFGAALGGIFALVFALVQGRALQLGARATSAIIAAAGFVSVALVPFLKYPANPPAVGEAETIGLRTGMFFLMLAISVAGMAVAIWAARQDPRRDAWNRTLTGAAVYAAVIAAAWWALPTINEVGPDFPGDLLWQFRTMSLVIQAALWAALGLLFGWLVERQAPQRRGRLGAV